MLNKIKTVMKIRQVLPVLLLLGLFSCLSAQEQPPLPSAQDLVAHLALQEAVTPTSTEKEPAHVPSAVRETSHSNPWGRYICTVSIAGDTVPVFRLKELNIFGSHLLLTQKEVNRNSKLIRNVKIMLPYAREAKRRLDALEVEIASMPVKERKAALKQAEKDIEAQYKKDLKRRTYSQGLVLIKLIDRETSRSAYSLVNDLRGSLRAGLYQACARLFGYNLKSKFDPAKDSKDNLIDRIVKSIDYGAL